MSNASSLPSSARPASPRSVSPRPASPRYRRRGSRVVSHLAVAASVLAVPGLVADGPVSARIARPSNAIAAAAADATLADRVAALTKDFKGTTVLYAKHLGNGRELAVGADTKVRTASTIKLPILCALESLVAAGKVRWDERLTLKPEDKVSGSGVLASLADGSDLTVRNVAILMIIVSDNTATNLILDRISADAVNDYLDTIGLTQTRANRKVRGDGTKLAAPTGWSKAGQLDENKTFGLGVSTPREMVRLLTLLHEGKVVTPDVSRDVVSILKEQQVKAAIGRHAPNDWTVASKSGSLDALRSDVALVYSKGGPIALAITVDGMPETDYSPDNAGEKLIWELTQTIVEGLSSDDATMASTSTRASGITAMSTSAAGSTQTPAAGKPTPPPPGRLLLGRFDAISNTATSITGNLVVTENALAFALDQKYETRFLRYVPASDVYAKGAGSWADLQSVPKNAPVELREVAAETVGPKAPNKGLCAPAKTTFVALVSSPDAAGGPALAVAAFKGKTPPGPDAPAADLCGTFRYAPAAGR